MLLLQKQTDYALQLLKILSKQPRQTISLKEISKKTGVSFLFLQKIARKLRLAGIIEARQGVQGGYNLRRRAKKLNLKKIMEIMEGRCALIGCIDGDGGSCSGGRATCSVKKSFGKLNQEIGRLFSRLTLDKL